MKVKVSQILYIIVYLEITLIKQLIREKIYESILTHNFMTHVELTNYNWKHI